LAKIALLELTRLIDFHPGVVRLAIKFGVVSDDAGSQGFARKTSGSGGGDTIHSLEIEVIYSPVLPVFFESAEGSHRSW
jgi:hypothetical protein